MRISNQFFLVVLILLASSVFADQKITDSNGNVVILKDDFTWSYDNSAQTASSDEIVILNRAAGQTALLESETGSFKVYYDPVKLKNTKVEDSDAEFTFSNVKNTGFGMAIYDGLEFTLDALRMVLIENAKDLDPDAKIISYEKCIVNGFPGELVTYSAAYSSIQFIFYAFISSNASGTIQYTFYTTQKEFEKLKTEFQYHMAGFFFKE